MDKNNEESWWWIGTQKKWTQSKPWHTSAHCKYNLKASSGDGTADKASIV